LAYVASPPTSRSTELTEIDAQGFGFLLNDPNSKLAMVTGACLLVCRLRPS
jgi:hypothetical protein